MKQSIIIFLLSFLYPFNTFGQSPMDSTLLQVFDIDSITPIIGATVTLFPKEGKPLRLITDSIGNTYISNDVIARRIQISYFGDELLDSTLHCWQKQIKFYVNSYKVLDEVKINGYRKMVKHSLIQDVIKIKDVEVFKHQNLGAILNFIPGALYNDEEFSYFRHPIAGIRLGTTGVLKPVTKEIINNLRSLFTENIDEIRLKKLTLGHGIQYELIIILNKDNNYSLTPSLEAYSGKNGNVIGNVFTQLSKNKFNTTLLITGELLKKMKGEFSIYNYGNKKTIIDFADKECEKYFYADYSGEFTFNKALSAGLNLNYGIDNTKKRRNSVELLEIKDILYYPQKFNDFTGSFFLNSNMGNHTLHWEASYNRSISDITVSIDNIQSQHLKNISISPNSFLEYTYTNKSKNFSVNGNIAYSYLEIKNMDSNVNNSQNKHKEHTFTSGVSIFMEYSQFSGNAVLQVEHNNNNHYKTMSFLPKVSLRYSEKSIGIDINYAKTINRPLAWMLTNYQTIETGKVLQSGNNLLTPSTKHQVDASLTYSNFVFCLSKQWVNNVTELLADNYDKEGNLIKKWQNIGKIDSWGLSVYYNLRKKHYYLNPSINLEFGRFYNGYDWRNNHLLVATVPFQLMFGDHKISLNTTYIAKNKSNQRIINDMFIMDINYSYYIPRSNITLSLFARDIFNQKSIETYSINDKQYQSSTILYKDKRQFGISIVYEFSKGNTNSISGARNNQNRNK